MNELAATKSDIVCVYCAKHCRRGAHKWAVVFLYQQMICGFCNFLVIIFPRFFDNHTESQSVFAFKVCLFVRFFFAEKS